MLITNTFFVLLLFYNAASQKQGNAINGKTVDSFKTLKFNSNHPPAVYDIIPVEEDESVVEVKREEKSTDEKLEPISDIRKNNEPDIGSTKIQLNTELLEDDLNTTVNPTTVATSRRRSGRNYSRSRRNRNRHLQRKEGTEDKKESNASDEVTTSSSSVVKDSISVSKTNEDNTSVLQTNDTLSPTKSNAPRTFPKRPAEFNPVFKKKRQRDPVVKIVNEKNFIFSHSGNFHYSYEGGDGTKVSSQGELKSSNNDSRKAGEAVVGSVFYKDKDGNDVSLSYTADENGYRPQGAHLPTPPPIPPIIARALAYLATKPTEEPVTEAFK